MKFRIKLYSISTSCVLCDDDGEGSQQQTKLPELCAYIDIQTFNYSIIELLSTLCGVHSSLNLLSSLACSRARIISAFAPAPLSFYTLLLAPTSHNNQCVFEASLCFSSKTFHISSYFFLRFPLDRITSTARARAKLGVLSSIEWWMLDGLCVLHDGYIHAGPSQNIKLSRYTLENVKKRDAGSGLAFFLFILLREAVNNEEPKKKIEIKEKEWRRKKKRREKWVDNHHHQHFRFFFLVWGSA